MRLAYVSILSMVLAASPVLAQDLEPESSPDPAAPDAQVAPEPESQPFPIRRGFYAEADLGVFLTLLGRNTNKATLPAKSTSNAQPYLGITLGYDVLEKPGFTLGVGLKLAAGYSSGAGRISDTELNDGSITDVQLMTRPNDFAVYEIGVSVAMGFMVHERVAITLKLDGGMGAAYANPYLFASETGAAGAAIGGMAGGSLGVEYFTLLNDFSVGLDLRGAGVFIAGNIIPAVSITAPIKYTF
jgi:hypothetical protein